MKTLLVAAIGGVAFAVAALGWYVYPTSTPISVNRPLADTPRLQPLPPSRSSLSLPIVVPIQSFEDYLNEVAPESERGDHPVDLLGVRVGKIRWSITRTPISMTGRDGRLHLSSRVKGWVLYGARINIAANATASTRLDVASNWRVRVPDLRLGAQLSRARLFDFISIKDLLQGPVNLQMDELGDNIRTKLESDPFLENEARKAWAEVCGTFLVDKGTGLRVAVKPLALRTAPPIIDDTTVRLQLGLDAEIRVVTGSTNFRCEFPRSLAIDPPQRGRLNLVLSAEATYEWLSDLLNQRVVGTTVLSDVHLQIQEVELRPYGNAILVGINLVVRTGNWFGKRAEGYVYVVARPVLDIRSQTIDLTDLALDTESRNALVAILGEAVEPVLLGQLNSNSTIDLKPQIQEIRSRSEKVFDAISGGGFEVDGQVESIELTRIDVGRNGLRIVSETVASVHSTLRKIQLGR